MAGDPAAALGQLRHEASSGTLAELCSELGIDLLVAFGSATDPDWPVAPRDLDVAIVMAGDADLLSVINGLAAHLDDDALVISTDLATEVQASAGLRNILVHQYLDVDLGIVAAAVSAAIGDYSEYVRPVAPGACRELSRRSARAVAGGDVVEGAAGAAHAAGRGGAGAHRPDHLAAAPAAQASGALAAAEHR
jgi:hypothetical protein